MTKSITWKKTVNIAKKIKKDVETNQKMEHIEGYSMAYLIWFLGNSVLKPKKDFTITKSLANCNDCTGTSIYKNLTKKQYTDVIVRTVNYLNDNGKLPNYTSFGKDKIRPKLLLFALAKIIVFYDKNGAMPNTCWVADNVFYSTKTTGGNVCKKLSNATSVSIKDYKSMYRAMSKFIYDYYYEDRQTQAQTIARKKGNCVDLNQVEYKGLIELYDSSVVQIVRGTVRCSDGKIYGHVWCRIKVSGNWINIDASAAAKGKSLGTVICPSVVSITAINPAWAVNDTGA